MAESTSTEGAGGEWESFVEGMNRPFVDAMRRNLEAQMEFAETWTEAAERSAAEGNDPVSESVAASLRAYETWMEASYRTLERMNRAMAEEERVPVEEIRDIWLDSTNRAFKELMTTEAFAALMGQSLETTLDAKTAADELTEETLHNIGFASVGDVREVGGRLVELERRQQDVERTLDRILEEVREG